MGNGLPTGGVNRKIYTGQTVIDQPFTTWLSHANNESELSTIANIDLEVVQQSDSIFDLGSVITFVDNPDFVPFVSVFLLENDNAHPQKMPDATDNENYIHQHVLKRMYTAYNGDAMVPDSISVVQGTVVEKTWSVTLPSNVDYEKASLVVAINYNDASNKEVINCKEVKLKP